MGPSGNHPQSLASMSKPPSGHGPAQQSSHDQHSISRAMAYKAAKTQRHKVSRSRRGQRAAIELKAALRDAAAASEAGIDDVAELEVTSALERQDGSSSDSTIDNDYVVPSKSDKDVEKEDSEILSSDKASVSLLGAADSGRRGNASAEKAVQELRFEIDDFDVVVTEEVRAVRMEYLSHVNRMLVLMGSKC